MIEAGYVKVYRATVDHPLVRFGQPVKPADPKRGAYSRSEAWLDLIMLARWKDGKELNKGRTITILIGQLQAAGSFLETKWNWTKKTVRHFLKRLVEEGMIIRSEGSKRGEEKGESRGNQNQIITICNYRLYQSPSVEPRASEEASEEASEGQHLKKERKEKKDLSPIGDSSSAPAKASPDDLFEPAPTESEPPKLTASIAAREAFALYNETAKRCGLPVARVFDKERAKNLALRVKDAGGLDGFRQAMANIERSAFLRGQSDSGFKADMGFICQRKSFLRLLEGGYGNGAGSSSRTGAPTHKVMYNGMELIS